MALHEQSSGATDEWYTPLYIFDALGCQFDMDVAHPGRNVLSHVPADCVLSALSLDVPWRGFVWMNPPFGGRNGIVPWLDKFIAHGNGIALTPDRTSAPWWQRYAEQVDLILFVSPKIKFIGSDGRPGKSPAQGTALMAKGAKGCAGLVRARSLGILFRPVPAPPRKV